MARQGISPNQLARVAGVDPATVADFLAGTRWPRIPTLAKFDTALGFEVGTLDALANDAQPPEPEAQMRYVHKVFLDLTNVAVADLSETEYEEAAAVATAAFLERAREIRNQRAFDPLEVTGNAEHPAPMTTSTLSGTPAHEAAASPEPSGPPPSGAASDEGSGNAPSSAGAPPRWAEPRRKRQRTDRTSSRHTE